MRTIRNASILIATLALAVVIPKSSRGANLLANPGFDSPTPGLSPPNYETSISGMEAEGPASADSWVLYNNEPSLTTSELLPSTDPNGGGDMISIVTTGGANGLFQYFSMAPGATASVDVYVLSGAASLYLFTDAGTVDLGEATSTTVDQWQTLTVTATSGNADMFVLYSYRATETQSFYADNAQVSAIVPEPSSLTMSAIATVFGLAYRFRIGRAQPRESQQFPNPNPPAKKNSLSARSGFRSRAS